MKKIILLLLGTISLATHCLSQKMAQDESQGFLEEIIFSPDIFFYKSTAEIPIHFIDFLNKEQARKFFFIENDSSYQHVGIIMNKFQIVELVSGGKINGSGFILYKICGPNCRYYCIIFRIMLDRERYNYSINLLQPEIEDLKTLKDYLLEQEDIFQK